LLPLLHVLLVQPEGWLFCPEMLSDMWGLRKWQSFASSLFQNSIKLRRVERSTDTSKFPQGFAALVTRDLRPLTKESLWAIATRVSVNAAAEQMNQA
jgi:hypothetical protein